MKKIIALALTLALVFTFAACGQAKNNTGNAEVVSIDDYEKTVPSEIKGKALSDLKVGFIFIHDQNSTYDKNFIDAAKAACAAKGLSDSQLLMKTNIPEGEECYVAAKELVTAGCDFVFADSFGHEPYMIKAAKEFPDVQFGHATGTRAIIEGVPNYHTAFAEIYKGRYLVGVAAGMKLNQLIEQGKFTAEEAKMGYVGAFPYAEVISGFTSFYLGAKSVCPSVTMEVEYTNSWFDITGENTAANALIKKGCKLISQHADSSGAPSACEEAGIPNVAYNIDTSNIGPNTALASSKINWQPYFEMWLDTLVNGGTIPSDYCATLKDGAVEVLGLNPAVAAPGTAEAIEEAKKKLENDEIKVFDTDTFTVGGKKLTSYMADIVDLGDYVPDSEAIVDNYFAESVKRSGPYFNVIIDGITVPKN